MRIKAQQYDTMRVALKAVVDHAGGAEAVRKQYATKTMGRLLWDLWHVAEDNLRYDDTHPGFANGHWPRVFPHNPSFDLYANGVNDSHIETALRKIGKELGL